MKIRVVFLAFVASLALLAACSMVVDPNFQLQSTSDQIEPEAGQWQTWVLTSMDEVRPAPPPDQAATLAEIAELKALAGERDQAAQEIVAYWDAGAPNYRWLDTAVAQFAQASIRPSPRLSRGLALMNVAIYDATIAAWEAKYTYNRPRPSQFDPTLTTLLETPNSPSYPSEHAAAAGAVAAILSYLFPDNTALFEERANEMVQSRLVAGVNYPSDIEAGLALGRAVAEKVIERAMVDGSDAAWDGVMPTEVGHWTGENPVDPLSGSWQTWVLESGDQLHPASPPAYDSEQMQTEMTALTTFTRTFASNAAAFFWQSPAGGPIYWFNVANRRIFEHDLDDNPPMAARIYAAMSVAQYDAFVGCYEAKYSYWTPRPAMVDPEFVTLFPAPNHPSYPSAHSCQSAAIATVLGYFFPAEAEVFNAAAQEAGDSRMWAGIHFQSDVDAGLELGNSVGQLVVEYIEAMVTPN